MYNLPTYYLLPLVGVNFKTFGIYKNEYNLKTTKINLKFKYLICEVYSKDHVLTKSYKTDVFKIIEGNNFIYKFPSHLVVTLTAFIDGKYSKIPENIKNFITKNCGLETNDRILMGLHKKVELKQILEEELEVKLADEAELLEAPSESWFV